MLRRWERVCPKMSRHKSWLFNTKLKLHQYGHSLHLYYEEWCKTNAGQPFFYWMELGDGKEIDLEECPRSKLHQQCIKYLGPVCDRNCITFCKAFCLNFYAYVNTNDLKCP